MNYKNLSQYEGDMSASDLCDAIVEAKTCNLPEIREAARMLVEDLRDAIVNAENLFYLVSSITRAPYINEHFAVFIFDDRYYAEKFVEKNSVLKLEIMDAAPNDYEWLFSYFYRCGAEGVDYCNDSSSVTFGINPFFLSDDYNENSAPGRLLARFVHLCMQEIRNEDRVYEKKDEIVNLLKRNIVGEALSTQIFIPVQGEPSQNTGMANARVAAMTTATNDVFFPVYTSIDEFRNNTVPGLSLAKTSLVSYIEFIENVAKNDEKVFGLAVNPEFVNFALNRGIMEIILANKQ